MKKCGKCKQMKDVSCFTKDKHAKDGLKKVCRDCVKELNEVYRQCDGYKERAKINAENNKENIRKSQREHYHRNKSKRREQNKQWYKDHPEWVRVKNRNIKSNRRNAVGKMTLGQWEICLEYFDNKCAYCGADNILLQIEHFNPLAQGGENTIDNIIPSCGHCNCSKGTKSFWEWYPAQPFYSKMREKRIIKYLNYQAEGIQQRTLLG